MNRFTFLIGIGMSLSLLSFCMPYVADAADSSNIQLVSVSPQTQQPTTVSNSAQSVTVKPDRNGEVACPPGYALTNLKSTSETHVPISVYTECNGLGQYYVHTWCKNGEIKYKPTEHAPTVSYTCLKIQNQWVSASN